MSAVLACPDGLAARLALLQRAPHMVPLRDFATRLRVATGRPVPEADPADCGAAARVLLLLLETPAPGIGIVSRDNAGGTAANLRRFLGEAGLARQDVLLWNLIPWMIHAPGARNRAPLAAEAQAGCAWLPALLELLPALRVAVLAGRIAAQAEDTLRAARPGLEVRLMPHPSPNCVCTHPMIAARIATTLADVAGLLRVPTPTQTA
ncbi:uracil-DNA glycosylase family protein [Falsiroseomonas sp. E2-1-a20]|uniref:uracil-DNA glycosylase family protein n=1 Tax=Falsiroseomonas sp. E2-1-a20 TaxID=3239300 RepID=UPI003F329AD8